MAPPSSARDALLAGVDVGGSALKVGVLARDGSQRNESSLEVHKGDAAPELFARAARLVLELAAGRAIVGAGVGLPGLLDREARLVRHSPNLPWLENVRVADELAGPLGLPPTHIRIENDAKVAVLGEQWLGAAQGARELLLLTLGTGIGGGLILRGELYLGEGLAGEVGHVNIAPDGPLCGCGSRGCLERFASASAARQRALAAGLPADAPGDLRRLAELARERAGPERELLEAVGYDLGHGLAAVVSLLDVRTFLFGGGFSAALDTLEPGIRRALDRWCYGERVAEIQLRRATLGPSAGWIGAARLALALG